MNVQNLVNLWRDYCDESLARPSFGQFMDWLEDSDTTPSQHRYLHVDGRRISCLNKTQIIELIDECVDIGEVRTRMEQL